jgi:hypothetical protein
MTDNDPLRELTETLEGVSSTLQEMRAVLVDQRDAVASNDLSRLLTITGQQEELGARLIRLERRHQRVRGALEQRLGVRGVRQIARRLSDGDASAGGGLESLAETVATELVELQHESRRSSELLRSNIELAQRTRAYLLRISGAQSTYLPIQARARTTGVEAVRPAAAS